MDLPPDRGALRRARAVVEATLADRRDLMLAHFAAIGLGREPKEALHKLRTFTGWYTHGLPRGRDLRLRISSLQTPAAFRAAVEEFFGTLDLRLAS